MAGSQDFAADPRNADLKVYVSGQLVPKDRARVSVFDAGFVLGDGVWEGLRLHKGRLLFLETHLERLYEGLKAIALDIGMTPAQPTAESQRTPDASGMAHGAHLRLMGTRGEKKAVNQEPRNRLGKTAIALTG